MEYNKFDYIVKEQSPENIEFLRNNNKLHSSNVQHIFLYDLQLT